MEEKTFNYNYFFLHKRKLHLLCTNVAPIHQIKLVKGKCFCGKAKLFTICIMMVFPFHFLFLFPILSGRQEKINYNTIEC